MAVEDILLLRVGLDSSSGRGHGPLFEDNSFEYIPIPESSETTEERTYDDLPARTGGRLSAYVPHLASRIPHFDPEFESFTYGDLSKNKRSQLSRLTTNDLLIFYSSLSPKDVDVGPRLCVIGYFVVDTVYDLAAMSPDERDATFENVESNAHTKREGLTRETPHRENYPVVVKGDPEQSRLFTQPLPLGNEDRKVLPWVADVIGFESDLTRAGVARVLDEDNADEIRRWLALGADYLVGADADLWAHTTAVGAELASDATGEHYVLTTGARRTRADAEVGDWIAEISKSDSAERLTYLMRVDETMSYDEYHRDERFEAVGAESDPRRDDSRAPEDETDRVLVGSLFWDFGESGVPLPERLRRLASGWRDSESGRSTPAENGDVLRELVSWVSLRFDPGVNAKKDRAAVGD